MKSTHYPILKNKYFIRSLLLILFILLISSTAVQAEMLSVSGDKVNLRKGPGKNYSVKWEYGSGFPLKVVERKGDWLKVIDFEDDTGWVHKSLLIRQAQTIVKANRNLNANVNIRNGPGSDNRIVGKAYYGVVFRVLQHQSGWVNVKHESGLTGWISTHLLWGH